MKIKCVTGNPNSGKTTYVREHIGNNDVRFDYDEALVAFTNKQNREDQTEEQKHFLNSLRYKVIEASKKADIETLWIIAVEPSDELKEALGDDCEYIHINDDHSVDEQRSKTMIRDNREYRNLPMFAEVRAEGEAERTYKVEGYASTFDEYELFNDGSDSFCERIEPTAFDKCDMSDVVFLLDHEGRVYARTRNGSVTLNVDENGLHSEIDLSRSSSARAVLEDIECGNYDRMSFAFVVTDDEVTHDQKAHKYLRTIKSVGKLFDISAVSFPANPNTGIGVSARSAFDGFIEEEKRLELVKAEEARALAEAKRKILEMEI